MEFINVQLLTLLTSIIAVMSNFLSLNEKIAKMGIVNLLKILCYYVLPVLFIKQIILFTYNYKFILTIIFSVVPTIIFVIVRKNKVEFFSKDDKHILNVILISTILLIIQLFFSVNGIDNYSNLMTDYISGLNNKMGFYEMLQYISGHLAYTLFVLNDTIILVLFAIVGFKAFFYYKNYLLNESEIDLCPTLEINFKKFTYNVIILFMLSPGLSKNIIDYICTTIIF